MRPVRMALWHVFCNSASAGGAGGPAAAPSATGPGSSGAGREDGGSAGDTSPRPPAASGRAFEGAVLCNLAAGTDGWYPVAPFGDHPHPYGMQCLAPEDGATLVAWANGQGPDWTGVPVHANPAHPKDGPALAWVKRFRVLGNELQCLPEWSPAGEEAILVNRQFKRVTPCWTCEPGGDGKWHPVNLLHIGLTNAPNIKAARPWVNADGAADGDGSGGQPPEPPPRDQGGPSDSPEQGTAAGQPESRPPGAAAPVADASRQRPRLRRPTRVRVGERRWPMRSPRHRHRTRRERLAPRQRLPLPARPRMWGSGGASFPGRGPGRAAPSCWRGWRLWRTSWRRCGPSWRRSGSLGMPRWWTCS